MVVNDDEDRSQACAICLRELTFIGNYIKRFKSDNFRNFNVFLGGIEYVGPRRIGSRTTIKFSASDQKDVSI